MPLDCRLRTGSGSCGGWPGIGWLRCARLPPLALLIYLAMPPDIVPDFIPVLGQLDDLLIAGVAVWWFLRACPPRPALELVATRERTPLGRVERALPWVLGGAVAGTGVWVVVWLTGLV